MTPAPPPRRTRALLIAWYCLSIGSVGAIHPMLSLLLTRRGATESAAALVLALFPLGLLLSGPAWGWASDRGGRPKRTLFIAISVVAIGALLLLLPGAWWMLVPGLALMASSRGASVALGDVHTLRLLGGGEEGSARYGGVRVWGSVTFVAAVQGASLLAAADPQSLLYVHAAMILALVGVTAALPEYQPTDDERTTESTSLWDVVRHPALGPLLFLSVLHVGGISTYDNLFSAHAAGKGVPDGLIGTAIALGVSAEIAVLALSPWLLRRFPGRALLTTAVLTSIPRWLVTGLATSALPLVAVQVLHGASFGLWWVGGVAFVARVAPPHLRGSAQGAFLASGFGLGALVSLLTASVAIPVVGTSGVFLGLAAASTLAALVLPWALRRS